MTLRPSIRDLEPCAAAHLRSYTAPDGPRAFRTYDRMGATDRLDPVDLLAPALLDAPLRGRHVIEMYWPRGPYRTLFDAMSAVLMDRAAATARFEDQDLDSRQGPWGLVRDALIASDSTHGIKASKVTKILHRKRPRLVPIFDSRVARYYGVSARQSRRLWPILKREILAHGSWLKALGDPHPTIDGLPLAPLRVLDIVVWEHSIDCSVNP